MTKIAKIVEDYSTNIYVKTNSNISSEMAEIAIFRFSSYKSMETLSCHSNQSSGTRTIKTQTL